MSDDSDAELSIFNEPAEYLPKPKSFTYETVKLDDQVELQLRLVGHNPLWGHLLWNAGRVLSHYLQTHRESLVDNKAILELGAGAGLPAMTCAVLGARSVVITDYPDAELIENLRHNIDTNAHLFSNDCHITAEGYKWGDAPDSLLPYADVSAAPPPQSQNTDYLRKSMSHGLTSGSSAHGMNDGLGFTALLPDSSTDYAGSFLATKDAPVTSAQNSAAAVDGSLMTEHSSGSHMTLAPNGSQPNALITTTNKFDTLILADLLFNHVCHPLLLQSITTLLRHSPSARALIFFTPYRPWLLEKDLSFFTLVKEQEGHRLVVKEIGKWMMDRVLFEEDRGDERLRRTVFGFEVSWRQDWLQANGLMN